MLKYTARKAHIVHDANSPCPRIDSMLKLMTVWRIAAKISRTTIMVNYTCTHIMEFLQF